MAAAMIAILARVPNPGFSFNGIHNNKTTVLIAKVDQPIVMSSLPETPCARTDHGALPIVLWIRSESPRPNMKRPKNKTDTREGLSSQRDCALQGVCGTVLCGRKNSINGLDTE